VTELPLPPLSSIIIITYITSKIKKGYKTKMMMATVMVVTRLLALLTFVHASLADATVGLNCDFEERSTACRWQWSRFTLKSAAEINATLYSVPNPYMISGPYNGDADGRLSGKLLFISLYLLHFFLSNE